MRKSKLLMAALVTTLGATPMAPSVAAAQDRDDRGQHEQQREHEQREHEQRFHDRDHHDYHMWNADEDRHYREYLAEHHREYHEFSRLSAKQQREYWRWRHEHEDRR